MYTYSYVSPYITLITPKKVPTNFGKPSVDGCPEIEVLTLPAVAQILKDVETQAAVVRYSGHICFMALKLPCILRENIYYVIFYNIHHSRLVYTVIC